LRVRRQPLGGYGGDRGDSSGDVGGVDRSLGAVEGYINTSQAGDTANTFYGNSTISSPWIAVAQYCDEVIVEYGANDVFVSLDSVGTIEGHLSGIYALFTLGQTVKQTTLTPRTVSTDGWTSAVNQTADNGETVRVSINDALRAATFGPSGGHLDLESVLETSIDSGLWKYNGACRSWTGDGAHPNQCGYLQIQASGEVH